MSGDAYQRWVRRTRESVMRQLVRERIPMSQQGLEDNLDITRYVPALGFVDRRSEREIGAALRWLSARGYARRLREDERQRDDWPGVLYEATVLGEAWAKETEES